MPELPSLDAGPAAGADTHYGPYRWSGAEAVLRMDGQPLALEGEDLALLSLLVERAGQPVGRAEVAAHLAARLGTAGARDKRLWSRVAGVNAALKRLSDTAGYIAFHPAQGFSLVIPPIPAQRPAGAAASPHGDTRLGRLPQRNNPVFGREPAMRQVAEKLAQQRLVTIVGAGGLGKTTLAVATARFLADHYADGVAFVDLAPIPEAKLLTGLLASALELGMVSNLPVLTNQLGNRQQLLVLDCCEHLVDTVASLAESILSACPRMHILATSREPLKALGERLHRLDPMGLPAAGGRLTVGEALAYPAIQLFVQTARLSDPAYQLTDANAEAIAALCRRLDGMPLAIELMAAHAASLGTEAFAGQLEGHLLELASPHKEGPERHRTLAHMLDWSYGLLSEAERAILRRLAIFPRGFSLGAASQVVSLEDDDPDDVADTVLNLMAKSLVTSRDAHGHAVLQLLDTTAAYALEKLASTPDHHLVARQHALYMRDTLRDAEEAWTRLARQDWRRAYSPCVDDVRAALGWAFSAEGDARIALELTLSAVALAIQTTLLADYAEWANKAVDVLPQVPGADPETVIRILSVPLLVPDKTPRNGAMYAARLDRAIAMAGAAGMPTLAAAPMLAQFSTTLQEADYLKSEHWSQEMLQVAEKAADPVCRLIGARMLAQSLHFLGRHAQALAMADHVWTHQALRIPIRYYGSYVQMGVSIRIVLARSRWMMGFADQAEELVRQALALAEDDNPAALCQVHALAAIPVAIWRGDRATALERLDRFKHLASSFNFSFWQAWGAAFTLALQADGGTPEELRALVHADEPSGAKMRDHLCSFSTALLGPDTLQRARAGLVGWCAPEALRSQGEALLRSGQAAADAPAQALFRQAMALAREQGALAWELRAATSLARQLSQHHQQAQASSLLREVYGRFAEGLATADLQAAAALLAELAKQVGGPVNPG